MNVEVVDSKHRRSPFVHGDLEIPITVIVEVDHSLQNKEILERYKGLVQSNYKEPTNGNFDDCTKEVLAVLYKQSKH